jgi:hypothetical protein
MYPCTDSGVRKLHMYRCTDVPDFSQKAAYHSGTDVPISVKKLRTRSGTDVLARVRRPRTPWALASVHVPMYRLRGSPTFRAYARGIFIKMRKTQEGVHVVMRPSWRIGTSVHLVPQPVHA